MDNSSSSSKSFLSQLSDWFELRHVYGLLVSLVVIFSVLLSYYYERRQDFSVGDIAPFDIVSPSTQPFYNRIKTEELRKLAEEKVSIIYRKDPLVLDDRLDEINFLHSFVQSERLNRMKRDEEKIHEIARQLGDHEQAELVAGFLIQTDERLLIEVFDITVAIMKSLLEIGLLEADQENLALLIESKVENLTDQPFVQTSAIAIVTQKIRPNMTVDEDATYRRMEEARQKIVPIRETIVQNEIIVEQGRRITLNDYEKLKAIGRISEAKFYRDALKALIYSLLMLFLLVILMFHLKSTPLLRDWKDFVLLFSMIAGFVLIVRIVAPINQFYIPVLIFAILIRVFARSKVSYYYVMVVTSLTLMAFNVDFALIIAYLLSSFAATVFYSNFKTTTDYFIKGLYSSLSLAGISFLFLFYFPESVLYQSPLLTSGIIFSNGMIASLVSLGIIIILGNFADFATPLRLFELSDPNSPLLRKLFEIAPGTYQHSIVIANLASHAASAIGADPLLARVGAYYHDIGKTVSPMSFTENNAGKNLLDEMKPIEAVKILKSHVAYGLELSKKYRLPSIINFFIASHHGDNRISFMYESAKKANNKIKNDKFFRYPGPKPVSKEESIVMIADSVEAAARSLEEKTLEKLKKLIDSIVDSKIKSNQLDDSNLTYSDLIKIKKSFLMTLDSLYHARLNYPSVPNEEEVSLEG